MAFQFSNSNLSINGQSVCKIENVEIEFVKHDNSVPIPKSLFHSQSIEINLEFEAIAEEVWNELCRSFGFPEYIPSPPEWVSRVIRIPDRRIKQILGG